MPASLSPAETDARMDVRGRAGEFCPLCGATGEVVYGKEGTPLRECRNFHPTVLLAWAWSSDAEYEAFYEVGCTYHEEEANAIGRSPFWMRDQEYLVANHARVDFLRGCYRWPVDASIADIGAGTGSFLAMWQAQFPQGKSIGVEPNGLMVRQAKALGRNVVQGSWNTWEHEEQYDLVALCDVFEHLRAPAQCLRWLIATNRAPFIYIEMPEWDSTHQRSQGFEWYHIKPRQHLCLYSRGAAEQLYESVGLEVVGFYRPLMGTIGKMGHLLKVKDHYATPIRSDPG